MSPVPYREEVNSTQSIDTKYFRIKESGRRQQIETEFSSYRIFQNTFSSVVS